MLSEQKFRITHQRQIILEELAKVESHPTADEVYRLVRRRLPRISLGTVYRNLEILSHRGMIQRLDLGGMQRRYDANTAIHYHVRCLGCGRVEDVTTSPVALPNETVQDDSDYEILGHRLEFIGLCPRCQKKK